MARFGTITAAVVQSRLLVAAQRDISRRPASEIRGSKAMWRASDAHQLRRPGHLFHLRRQARPVTPGQLRWEAPPGDRRAAGSYSAGSPVCGQNAGVQLKPVN